MCTKLKNARGSAKFLRGLLYVELFMVFYWIGILFWTLFLLSFRPRLLSVIVYGFHAIAPAFGFLILEDLEEFEKTKEGLLYGSTTKKHELSVVARIHSVSWSLGIGMVLVTDVFSLIDTALIETTTANELALQICTCILWGYAVFSTIAYLTLTFIYRAYIDRLESRRRDV
jgi:hypothetical protein